MPTVWGKKTVFADLFMFQPLGYHSFCVSRHNLECRIMREKWCWSDSLINWLVNQQRKLTKIILTNDQSISLLPFLVWEVVMDIYFGVVVTVIDEFLWEKFNHTVYFPIKAKPTDHFHKLVDSGCVVAYLVERAHHILRLCPSCSGPGLIPTCGPLLHGIPSLPLSIHS